MKTERKLFIDCYYTCYRWGLDTLHYQQGLMVFGVTVVTQYQERLGC